MLRVSQAGARRLRRAAGKSGPTGAQVLAEALKESGKRLRKYGAKKDTVIDGHRFDSRKEARHYAELKLREKAGEIRNLQVQPEYDLHAPNPEPLALEIRIGAYRADFTYMERDPLSTRTVSRWDRVVSDVKGYRTPLYRWKRKHFEAEYGLTIREV